MEINATFNQIEKSFNIAGSLPIVGFFSGTIRSVIAGALQVPGGYFVGGVGLVGQLIFPESQKCANVTRMGAEHILHGVLNTIRGAGEAASALTLGLVPLVIQSASDNGFDPVFKYGDSSSQINHNLNELESAYNFAGSIPVVALFSGASRASLGAIQCKIGLIGGGAGLVGQIVHPDSKNWQNVAQTGIEHMIHGVLNVVRGMGEGLLAATVVGPVIPLVMQAASSNGFDPRIKYSVGNN